jgi:hypothetical protein
MLSSKLLHSITLMFKDVLLQARSLPYPGIIAPVQS